MVVTVANNFVCILFYMNVHIEYTMLWTIYKIFSYISIVILIFAYYYIFKMHQNLFTQSLLLGIYVVNVHFENFSGECSTYRGNHLTIHDSWTKSSCLFMDLWARRWEWERRVSSGKVLSESEEVPQPRPPVRRDLKGGIWVRNVGMCISRAGWGGEKKG